MTWFTEPFEPEFMQRALVAGSLVAVTTAVVGTWVVIRGLTFMGDALAHGVLPGIAVAFLVGFDLTLGAAAGAAVMVGGIDVVHRRARLTEDAGIGLLFVGMLALGVIIVSRAGSFAGDLTGILFGDLLAVDRGDLALGAGATIVTIVAVVLLHRSFLVTAFDPDKARLLGLRPAFAHVTLLVLVAGAVVTSFRAVGTLLVFAMLVGPPATATLLVRRVPSMTVTAAALGISAVGLGLLTSFHADTAAGATVAGVAVAQFFVVLLARELTHALQRSRGAS